METEIPDFLPGPDYFEELPGCLCPLGESVKGPYPDRRAHPKRTGTLRKGATQGNREPAEFWWAGPYEVFRSIYMTIFEK